VVDSEFSANKRKKCWGYYDLTGILRVEVVWGSGIGDEGMGVVG
jgi:hypothetical protein